MSDEIYRLRTLFSSAIAGADRRSQIVSGDDGTIRRSCAPLALLARSRSHSGRSRGQRKNELHTSS